MGVNCRHRAQEPAQLCEVSHELLGELKEETDPDQRAVNPGPTPSLGELTKDNLENKWTLEILKHTTPLQL